MISEPDLLAALARYAAGPIHIERVDRQALTGGHSAKVVDRLDLTVALSARTDIRAAFVRKACLAAEVRALKRVAAVSGATAAPELIVAWWSALRPYDPAANGFVSPFYPGGPLTEDDAIPDAVLVTLARVHADGGRTAPPAWTWTFDAAHFALRHAYALAALAASERFQATTADHREWLRRLERVGRSVALREASDALPRSFVHGDMHPRNIVRRADGSPVIIDWGNACIAPPMLDLATIVALDSAAWQPLHRRLPGGGRAARRGDLSAGLRVGACRQRAAQPALDGRAHDRCAAADPAGRGRGALADRRVVIVGTASRHAAARSRE
ncbi:MAG: aminoglycoside phosphotransferase family protein [Pseudomonadota bacterium]